MMDILNQSKGKSMPTLVRAKYAIKGLKFIKPAATYQVCTENIQRCMLVMKCIILLQMSDRGGGIPRSQTDLLFNYMYSTAPQPPKSDTDTVPLAGKYPVFYFIGVVAVLVKQVTVHHSSQELVARNLVLQKFVSLFLFPSSQINLHSHHWHLMDFSQCLYCTNRYYL